MPLSNSGKTVFHQSTWKYALQVAPFYAIFSSFSQSIGLFHLLEGQKCSFLKNKVTLLLTKIIIPPRSWKRDSWTTASAHCKLRFAGWPITPTLLTSAHGQRICSKATPATSCTCWSRRNLISLAVNFRYIWRSLESTCAAISVNVPGSIRLSKCTPCFLSKWTIPIRTGGAVSPPFHMQVGSPIITKSLTFSSKHQGKPTDRGL